MLWFNKTQMDNYDQVTKKYNKEPELPFFLLEKLLNSNPICPSPSNIFFSLTLLRSCRLQRWKPIQNISLHNKQSASIYKKRGNKGKNNSQKKSINTLYFIHEWQKVLLYEQEINAFCKNKMHYILKKIRQVMCANQ